MTRAVASEGINNVPFLSPPSQVLHDRLVLASDLYQTQVCKTCGTLGEIDAPSLGGLLDGIGFRCRACKTENSGLELQTTYCYGLFLKELGAMNIVVRHEVAKDDEPSKAVEHDRRGRIAELDDLVA